MFGNGKGLFGGGPMAANGAQPPAPRRGGIGGFLQRNQNTLAMAGDIISRAGGGQGNPVLAQMQQQRLMDYRTQAQKQQQDAEQQQWLARQAYERANQPPPEPTAMQRNLEYYMTLDPAQRAAYQDMNPEYRQGSDGRFYRVDTAQPAASTAPDTLPAGFDFGGGAGGNASGTFRR